MRITLNPTTYAEWWTGSRTINIYTMEPYSGLDTFWGPRWANTDCISFGYDKPDNSTTQIEMLAVLMRYYPVYPVDNYCPACGDHWDFCRGHGEIGDPYGYATLQAHDNDDHSRCHFTCEGN